MSPEFWRGRRVFLTGHTGFKGSWLSLWLHSLGADVAGYSLGITTQPSLFEVAGIADLLESNIGDVRDRSALFDALDSFAPEIVIHMAAQPLVRLSYKDPVETYSTNVMGTVNLFEAIRKTPSVRAVLNVTTDKCYENREWHWGYRETDPLGGYDPYSSSKACSELVSAAYRSSYFGMHNLERPVSIASARAGNVIGGGDWSPDRLVPDMIRAFQEKRTALIRNPDAIRPWQHVLEPLRGYLILGEKLLQEGVAYAEPWNFGPLDHDARNVASIADAMCRCWGDGANWQKETVSHLHEATYLKLDVSKASARLNWTPQIDLNTGISLIVDWFKTYHNTGDARGITLDQIARYQQLISG